MSPNPVPSSSGVTRLTINGSGFSSSSTLTFTSYPTTGGSNSYPNQPILSAGSGQIVANSSLGTTPSLWSVQVVTNGQASSPFWFDVAPVVSGIIPNPTPLGNAVKVLITGSGFQTGGSLTFFWTGGSRTRTDYTYLDSNDLMITINTGSSADYGWAIQYASPSGITSNKFSFSVHN
jgi:hypothetical protein